MQEKRSAGLERTTDNEREPTLTGEGKTGLVMRRKGNRDMGRTNIGMKWGRGGIVMGRTGLVMRRKGNRNMGRTNIAMKWEEVAYIVVWKTSLVIRRKGNRDMGPQNIGSSELRQLLRPGGSIVGSSAGKGSSRAR